MRFCSGFAVGFGIAYAISLALFFIGLFGLFGQPKDPLSGIFVLVLGLPWVRLLDGTPETIRPWVGLLMPAVNLALLYITCRLLRR